MLYRRGLLKSVGAGRRHDGYNLFAMGRIGVREGVMWLIRCMQGNATQRPPKVDS